MPIAAPHLVRLPRQLVISAAILLTAVLVLLAGVVRPLAAAQAVPQSEGSHLSPSQVSTIGGERVRLDGVPVAGLPLVQVAAGTYHAVALAADGRLYAWGRGTEGQLGNGTTTGSTTPVAVDMTGVLAGEKIVQVGAGYAHSAVLTETGRVYTWGAGEIGQLGHGALGRSSVPVAVQTDGVLAGRSVIAMAVGEYHLVALTDDRQVLTWGAGDSGRLGDGSSTNRSAPVAVTPGGLFDGHTITQVGAGDTHSMVVSEEGGIFAWGRNREGQLGTGSAGADQNRPLAVRTSGALAGHRVVAIDGGRDHTTALSEAGQLFSWGRGAEGQHGNGSTAQQKAPVAVDMSGTLDGKVVDQISSGVAHTLVRATDGSVHAWGRGTNGRLGDGGTSNSSRPVSVSADALGAVGGATQITAGDGHSIAIGADGTGLAWGAADRGQLGNGSSSDSSVPLEINRMREPAFSAHLGEVPAPEVVYDTATGALDVTTPAHPSGTVDLRVEQLDVPGEPRVLGQVTVGTAPEIVTAPAATEADEDGTAVLHATGRADEAPLVAWEVSDDPDPASDSWRDAEGTVDTTSDPTWSDGGTIVLGTTSSALTLAGVTSPVYVRALVRNGLGLERTPAARVDVVRGPVTLGHPVDGDTVEAVPLLSGRGTRGATVTVSVHGTSVGTTVVNTRGEWLFRFPTPLDLGAVTVSASQSTDGSEAQADVRVVGHAVSAWGDEVFGALPRELGSGRRVVQAEASGARGDGGLALTAEGDVVPWGVLGHAPTEAPEALAATRVVDIAVARTIALALTSEGQVVAWGGGGTVDPTVPPTLEGRRAVAVTAGGDAAYAVLDDGSLVAWGDDRDGQVSLPEVLTTETVREVAVGGDFSLALTTSGRVHAWGADGAGQTEVPAEVQGRATAISAGEDFALALLDDGTVVGWGQGALGQTTVPADIQGKVSDISAGRDAAHAVTHEGTVHTWGAGAPALLEGPGGLVGKVASRVTASENGAAVLFDDIGFTSPVDGGATVTNPTVSGHAAPGTSMELQHQVADGWTHVGTAPVGADGSWTTSLPGGLTPGAHSLRATSAFGSTTEVTVNVVDAPLARVVLTPRATLQPHGMP